MSVDIRAGRAFVELTLRNNLTKGLANARKQLKQLGDTATAFGKTLLTFGTASAVPLAFATKTFMDFDDQMRAVQGVTQSTDAELASMTATAKRLGASTSFTAVQVASLMTELGRAGFTASQIEEMTGAVLNLSRATGTDATLSAGIMAASIRQFNLEATDATRVADALTAAANKSFNSVESLGEALSYAGPVAADFGMSIEDTLAILGGLGNVGIQGSNAGTAIRRLLTLTGAEAEKLRGIFGVSFTDAAGNARPLVDVLHEVNQATAGLGTAERAKKFNEAFGLLGITGASAISKNAVDIKELADAIKGAGGVAEDTAKKMDAGLGGAFRIMMSAIEGVQIALGDALSPVLTKVAKQVEVFASGLIDVINNNKGLAVAALGAVAGVVGIGAALVGVGVAAKIAAVGIGAVLLAIKGVAFIVGALLSPLGLVATALFIGVAAWVKWTESGQAALRGLMSFFQPFADIARKAIGAIVEALQSGNIEGAGRIAMAGLVLAWETGKLKLLKVWISIRETILSTWTEVSAQLQGGFAFLSSIASKFVQFLQDSLRPAFLALSDMWTLFEASAMAAFTAVSTGIRSLLERMGGVAKAMAAVMEVGFSADAGNPQVKAARDAAKAAMGVVNAGRSVAGVGFNKILEDAQRARDEAIEDARTRGVLGAMIRGGKDDAATAEQSAAVRRAQQELDAAIEAAKKAREEQQAADEQAKAGAGAALAGAQAGARQIANTTDVSGSFSAAALVAMGGGGIQQRILDEQKKTREELKRQAMEQKRRDEKLQDLVRQNLLQVVG